MGHRLLDLDENTKTSAHVRLKTKGSGNPHSALLGSLDTLPRSCSLLQTKMATAPSKRISQSRQSHGKIGGLRTVYPFPCL